MHFAPDTEDVLAFDIALANTDAAATKSGDDELVSKHQLEALVKVHRFTGRFDRDDAELAAVIETRGRLRRLWALDRDAMAGEVNAMLDETHALPRLERHDGFDWHLHATPRDAPLAERIRAEAALALVDVIRTAETDRLRICEADDCEGVLVDLSRNGSKRFCSIRCGNRMNMVAYRERRASVFTSG